VRRICDALDREASQHATILLSSESYEVLFSIADDAVLAEFEPLAQVHDLTAVSSSK
jgi:hypothetical protein